MNATLIKQQLLRNRKQLAQWHNSLANYKELKKAFEQHENLNGEYHCHDNMRKCKEEIAKLVELQKALKADLSKELSYARSVRRMSLVVMGE